MYKRILLPTDGSDLSERAVLAGIDLARAAIIEAARRNVCDLIVMAAHGRRGLKGLLLAGAAGLYLALDETREGLFLMLMVLAMLGITLYQQGRTETALQALRNGRFERLPASALVPGDVIELGEGDRLPADAWLLDAAGVAADESLLTGESVPVAKCAAGAEPPPAAPGGEDQPWVYSGTLVVQGHALAQVSRTGPQSELGRIGSALGSIALLGWKSPSSGPPGALCRNPARCRRPRCCANTGWSPHLQQHAQVDGLCDGDPQQLGVLRDEQLVSTRREGKQVYYSIASKEALALMGVLYEQYCTPQPGATP